jgi:hypothetical protein
MLEALILQPCKDDTSVYVRIGVLWINDKAFRFFRTFETPEKESLIIK